MSRLDYSKWDHIDISDDEDDTHPNIDTPSLFRWRHQARLDRMAEAAKEKSDLEASKKDHQQQMQEIKNKLKESTVADPETKAKLDNLEKQEIEFKKKEEELRQKEKMTPWNVDTISKDAKSRTIINKDTPKKREDLTDEEKADKQTMHTKEYEKEIKKFGMLRKYEDSQAFLTDHHQLVCEETANYLVMWCINLAMEEKFSLMDHVSHQTIVMQFMLELSRQVDRDPRSCVAAFFSRIKLGEKQYMDAFNDELTSFRGRIRARAQEKIEQAMKEVEEEERQKRLGPGGLDPQEVFESLPTELQDCFEKREIGMLQEVMMKMSKEDAQYHLDRCIKSGLWVPGPQDTEQAEVAEEESEYATADEATGAQEEEATQSESKES